MDSGVYKENYRNLWYAGENRIQDCGSVLRSTELYGTIKDYGSVFRSGELYYTTKDYGSVFRSGELYYTTKDYGGVSEAANSTTRSRSFTTISTGTQTEVWPGMIEANRLAPYEGPFWITANGDRVHTVAGCYGQRNAVRAPKSYTLCQYCVGERPLFVLIPPTHT